MKHQHFGSNLLQKHLFLILLALVSCILLSACSQTVKTSKDSYKGKTIETVLGPISAQELGVTLMHEHIIWDWTGADESRKTLYTTEDVVNLMLPYLKNLKEAGCQTLVDGSPEGAGRDMEVLKLAAEKSGLNIITNTGLWNASPKETVPDTIKDKTIEEIVDIWVNEYIHGIGQTGIKPGFIKITLPDYGEISEEQEKYFRAAIRTSKQTGLHIQCHSIIPETTRKAIKIIEEEKLSFDKFIWIHADFQRNLDVIIEMAKKGIWVELDSLGRTPNFKWHIMAIKRLIDEDLIEHVLISQDAGSYNVGRKNDEGEIIPYDRIFTKFIPKCKEEGVSEEVIDKILIENPLKILVIEK